MIIERTAITIFQLRQIMQIEIIVVFFFTMFMIIFLFNFIIHCLQVLLVCFILCTLVYAATAISGYLMFGSQVQSEITLNLPKGKVSSKVAIYTTLINPITKYALMLTPIVNAVRSVIPWHSNRRIIHLIVSTTLLISTIIVAIFVPFFGYLMSLVGALLTISSSFLVPSVCYLKISGTYRRFGWDMIINYTIILMGSCIAVVGTCTSVLKIVSHLRK